MKNRYQVKPGPHDSIQMPHGSTLIPKLRGLIMQRDDGSIEGISIFGDSSIGYATLAIFSPHYELMSVNRDAWRALLQDALFEPPELDDDGGQFVPDPHLHEAHDEEEKEEREHGYL